MQLSRKSKIALNLAAASAVAQFGNLAMGQTINITSTVTPYTQSFDTLPTSGTSNPWSNGTTVTGWYAAQSKGTGVPSVIRAEAGAGSTGALYSFGTGTNTDRALGDIGSGTPGDFTIGAKFANATASSYITGINLTYNGEQWRNGGSNTPQTMSFAWSTDATSLTTGTWNTVAALKFSSVVTSATAAAVDGNVAGRTTGINASIDFGGNVTIGNSFWIKWLDIDNTGGDDGLAIDDVSMSIYTAPAPAGPRTLTWAGTGATDTWDTTASNWSDGAAQIFNPGTPDKAVFSATSTATNVFVGSGVTAANISFLAPNYTLSGGTVAIAGSAGAGIIANNSATISAPVSVGTAQTWEALVGSTLSVSGSVSGARVSKIGVGTLVLGASNSFAGVTITDGTLVISDDNQLGTGFLSLSGGTVSMTSAAAISSTRAIDIAGTSVLATNGTNPTLGTFVTGGASLTITGSSTITFGGTASSSYTGSIDPTDGTTIVIATASPTGQTGMGGGTLQVKNGSRVILDNVLMGDQTFATTTGGAFNIGNGGALLATGVSAHARSGGITIANTATLATIGATGATDVFTIQNSIRQTSSAGSAVPAGSTVVIGGLGKVILASGPSSASFSPSTPHFNGSWVVDSGTLQIGPYASGGFGEPLNALGYLYGPLSGVAGVGANKSARPVTINSGGKLLLASGARNPSASPALTFGTDSLRNPITLNGGTLQGASDERLGTPGSAHFSGGLTINGSSAVALWDGITATNASDIYISNHIAGVDDDVAAPITWNGTLTAQAGGTSTGTLFFDRRSTNNGGADSVTIGAGATLVVQANAKVVATNTQNPFSGGGNFVAIQNNGSLSITGGTKIAGNITGTGSTLVDSATASLSASTIRQASLTVSNGTIVTIRTSDADGTGAGVQGAASAVMKVGSLSIDGTSKLDLKNNGLIIPAAGNLNGSAITVDSLRAAIVAGRGGVGTGNATWAGLGGIGTSTFAFDETFDSIGYCWTGDPNILVAPIDVNGESYSAGDYVVKYCAGADADLNGLVDDTDVAVIGLTYDGGASTGHHWYEGDFNYDGLINDDDVAIIGLAYNPSGTPLTPSFYAALSAEYGSSFASAFAAGAAGTVVPEPASLGLLAVGAMGMLRRRRK